MNPLLIGLLFVLLSNEQDNICCRENDMVNDHKTLNGITTIKKMEEKREDQGFLGHESFSEALRLKQNDHSFLRPVPPPDILEKAECDCQS